jgi:hypothetical protein
MLGIFISRGGIPPGPPVPLDEAKRGVAAGKLRQDQLAWCRGLSDWKPLHEVIRYVEKKTSALLPVQGAEKDIPPAPVPLPPLQAPSLSRKPQTPPAAPPAVDQAHKKPDSLSPKMAAVVSAGNAVARTEVVPSEELGTDLWTFAKQCTREFRASLEDQFNKNNILLHEDIQFNFSQESLIFHLWLVSKVLGADRKPVEAMNRKYIHRQSEIAQTYEHHWEQVEYMRSAKESFLERFRDYHKLWNDHLPRAQTMAAAHLLKSILGPFTACTKPAENILVSFINSYLTKMPRAIAAFYEDMERKKA